MTVPTAVALSLLLITPLNSTFFSENSCLSQNFLGHYKNGQSTSSIFKLMGPDCLNDRQFLSGSPHILTSTPTQDRRLVWLEQETVEKSLLEEEAFRADSWLEAFEEVNFNEGSQETFGTSQQHVLRSSTEGNDHLQVLYRSDTAMLLSLPPLAALKVDTVLPRFWKSTLLPESPFPYRPISSVDIEPVKRVLTNLKFNPDVASIVNNISRSQILNDIRFLTGEDGNSGIVSRHSFSSGALTAANWIKSLVEDTGAKCRLETFLVGFAPNVICRYSPTKETNDTIIISGHYDSRGSFGSPRAPGGDDDGSGTTGILSIARTIGRRGVKFHKNVELVTFAGEEQGLLGSRAYSRDLRNKNASIILMIQADMTAYRAPGEPLQLGLPDRIGTPEVTQLVSNISALYSPELRVGYSGACCSDHQSFFEQGFPATQVFERAGPIVDPMYHNSGDLSEREGYDVDQLYAIAKVQFATVLHTSGFDIAE